MLTLMLMLMLMYGVPGLGCWYVVLLARAARRRILTGPPRVHACLVLYLQAHRGCSDLWNTSGSEMAPSSGASVPHIIISVTEARLLHMVIRMYFMIELSSTANPICSQMQPTIQAMAIPSTILPQKTTTTPPPKKERRRRCTVSTVCGFGRVHLSGHSLASTTHNAVGGGRSTGVDVCVVGEKGEFGGKGGVWCVCYVRRATASL